jgi:hypothetical protein
MATKKFSNDFLRIGGYVQTNKIIAQKIGYREATVLGHYLAKQKKWQEDGILKRGGKIYVRHEDIEAELGLSAHEHRTASENLEKAKLIKRSDPDPKKFNRVFIRIWRLNIKRFIERSSPKKLVKNFNEVDKRSSKNSMRPRQKTERELVKNFNDPSLKILTISNKKRSNKKSSNKKRSSKQEPSDFLTFFKTREKSEDQFADSLKRLWTKETGGDTFSDKDEKDFALAAKMICDFRSKLGKRFVCGPYRNAEDSFYHFAKLIFKMWEFTGKTPKHPGWLTVKFLPQNLRSYFKKMDWLV